MATAPFQPQNLTAEQADGNILVSWQGSLGATGYQLQRSTDGVNYVNYAQTGITNQYLDSLPGVGTQYWYQVAGAVFPTATFSGSQNTITVTSNTGLALGMGVYDLTNSGYIPAGTTITGISGTTITISNNTAHATSGSDNMSFTGIFSAPASMIAAPPSEMSLYELRLRSQQTADRVNSDFVTNTEWNAFLRIAMYELYDLLITSYEDYFATQQVFITTNGSTQYYNLPNGYSNYLGGTYTGVVGPPAQAFYKMAGVDLAVNTSTVNPAWVTLKRFNFIDRNKYIYPNSTSTIYGVYNQAYRIMGDQIDFIPVPAGNQTLRLWYTPKLPALLKDADLTTLGYSGWIRYPIVRAAKYALDKEEGSDTSRLDAEILFLKQRIEQAAQNRDAGIPDTISETRRDGIYGGTGWGNGMGGGNAGF